MYEGFWSIFLFKVGLNVCMYLFYFLILVNLNSNKQFYQLTITGQFLDHPYFEDNFEKFTIWYKICGIDQGREFYGCIRSNNVVAASFNFVHVHFWHLLLSVISTTNICTTITMKLASDIIFNMPSIAQRTCIAIYYFTTAPFNLWYI